MTARCRPWLLAALLACTAGPAPPADLDARRLESLWADLAAEDAPRAYAALCTLADHPRAAVPLLRAHLRPAPAPDRRRIARLIADLDHERFAVRQYAARELEKLAELAEPQLRKALAARPSLEVRQRVEGLLRKLDGPVTAPETLRAIRAVEVLERAGDADARRLLQSLAKGAPESRLTREARATLERLGGKK